MNNLVRVLFDDDGEKIASPKWCLVWAADGCLRTFCDGQAIGDGESAVVYDCKDTKRGGITCRTCLRKIKEIKNIKL